MVEVVGRAADLELLDIGYREAGEYRCKAVNLISGEERSTESEVITVQVRVREIGNRVKSSNV